jgi:hypothetical protein
LGWGRGLTRNGRGRVRVVGLSWMVGMRPGSTAMKSVGREKLRPVHRGLIAMSGRGGSVVSHSKLESARFEWGTKSRANVERVRLGRATCPYRDERAAGGPVKSYEERRAGEAVPRSSRLYRDERAGRVRGLPLKTQTARFEWGTKSRANIV